MWLKRGLVSSTSFLGLFVKAWPHYFGRSLNAVDRGIYFTRNPFRTGFLSTQNNVEILLRFCCSGVDNTRLVSAEDEDESENTVTAKDDNEFEFDEIDKLSEFLDDNMRNINFSPKGAISEEHLNYLTELADGNNDTLDKLKLCYEVIKRSTDTLGIDFRLHSYSWLNMVGTTAGYMQRNVKNQLLREIQKLNRENSKDPFPRINYNALVSEFDIHCYHLFHNAPFLRFQKQAMTYRLWSKGMVSMLYSPHLVYDCSYEQFMTQEEIHHVARQLSFALAENFRSPMPLHIVLCNFNDSLYLSKIIEKSIQKFYKNTVPLTVTEKSYMDLYPTEDLCYLSPNGTDRGGKWNPNKIYIVGAFVDKRSQNQKISLAKAKLHNISHMRFPIEKYLDWKNGSKCLSLSHVCKIMCNMYYYKDWTKALKSLPRRFTRDINSAKGSTRSRSYISNVVRESYHSAWNQVPRS